MAGSKAEQIREAFLTEPPEFRRRLVGDAPCDLVDIQGSHPVFHVTLHWRVGGGKATVKFLEHNTVLRDGANLSQIHERIRASDPRLTHALPATSALSLLPDCLVMQYVEGRTLLSVMRQRLGEWRSGPDDVTPLLAEVGKSLAALNRMTGKQVGLDLPAQTNEWYVPALNEALNNARPCDPKQGSAITPARIAALLPADFNARAADRLLLVDCKPENILVSDDATVTFVDLDYSVGNPALSLAQLLTSIDHLSLRHPMPASRRMIATWKRALIESYMLHAESWITQDLNFFYPWALARSMCEHPKARGWTKDYVRTTFSRALAEFLNDAQRSAVTQAFKRENLRRAA